ncbi:endonuclease III-like protein 1 isoform X2 [Parasteatoda tepidariorum]|uniref:endonuclease III-like protein 1 isoform X2 n=1 Tax=Parasteatoda tepidariorum TaxID=114398 RepID=UPI001C723E00|nr:endonuclease III-like protein 1 isoform X3 [Parasteatoda tepidariorum]
MQRFIQRLCQNSLLKTSKNFPFVMEGSNRRILRSRIPAKTDTETIVEKKTPKKSTVKTQSTKKPLSEKIKKQKDKTVVKKETIKSEYFEDKEKLIKSEVQSEYKAKLIKPEIQSDYASNTTRKRVAITTEEGCSVKPEKAIKKEPESVSDIEDGVWKPENWRQVLDNILKMRKMYVAPVDSLGCEECPEEGVLPEVFRYQTLISVMLSSQTRDEVTFAASQRLIEHGLTVDNILNTPDEKIGELIYPAGFWKSKIKFIKNTSQILKDKYNGDIPRTFKELIKLPGVGPKMANIVMSVAWNDTVGIAVDTHVHRISNRLGWVPKPTKDPEQTRKALESWLPKDLWKDVSLDLVGFGQTICKPTKPKCDKCMNVNLCPEGQRCTKR